MRFSLGTHIVDAWYLAGYTVCRDIVDVRSRARTYGQCVTGKPYFHQPSHSSNFLYFRVVLVALGLIDGFS
jgi:hypothetical protein